jgi:hypothetical protein
MHTAVVPCLKPVPTTVLILDIDAKRENGQQLGENETAKNYSTYISTISKVIITDTEE